MTTEREATGRLILEASTGMHGDVAKRLAIELAGYLDSGKPCEYCDDTGDVHGLDGEWRGSCSCPIGRIVAWRMRVRTGNVWSPWVVTDHKSYIEAMQEQYGDFVEVRALVVQEPTP